MPVSRLESSCTAARWRPRVECWLAPGRWPLAARWALVLLVGFDLIKHIVFLLAEPPWPVMDAREYWELAGLMAAGDWMWQGEPIAYRTPGYPAFLTVFRGLFGCYALNAALAAQHMVVMATSFLTAAACGWLARSSWAAVAGYGLSVMCYSRAWHANLLLTETLFTFFLVLLILVWMVYDRRPAVGWIACFGLFVGAASLVRPISMYLWLPVGMAMLYRASGDSWSWRRIGLHLAALLVSVQLVLAPWYVRNAQMFGDIFLTQFAGRNLWVVTFQDGAGAGLALGEAGAGGELRRQVTQAGVPVDLRHTWSVSNALRAAGLEDDDVDRLMLRASFEAIREAPGRVAERTARRLVNYWRCVSNPYPFYNGSLEGPEGPGERLIRARWAGRFYAALNSVAASRSVRMNELTTVLAFGGVLGMLWWPQTRTTGLVLALMMCFFAGITAIVEIPAYRYRMILEPLGIIAVSAGYAGWVGAAKRRFRARNGSGVMRSEVESE